MTGIKLRDFFKGWTDEDFKESFKEFENQYLKAIVEGINKDEEDRGRYLNKYEVTKLIRELAEASEPMVSAPSYDYYEINAGLLLKELDKLDTKEGL